MEIGVKLRNARENQNISLEEAEESTKIRKKYLEALENEEFDLLPGKVYVRGFLRNYARFLGVDGEELVSEYNSYLGKHEVEGREEEEPGTAPGTKTANKRNILYVLIGLIIILGAAIIFYGALNDTKNEGERKINDEIGENADRGNEASPDTGEDAGEDEEPEEIPGEEPEEENIEEIRVIISADGRCWTRVETDGEESFKDFLTAGDRKSFTAKENIYLHLGSAGAVNIEINGKELGFLGEKGEVVKKTYSLEDVKELVAGTEGSRE